MAKPEFYDLAELEALALELGLPCHREPSELKITLEPKRVLVFANLLEESDTIAGIEGFGSHFHGNILLTYGEGYYREYGPGEILKALRTGEVLLVERFLGDNLDDVWLGHRDEVIEDKYWEPEETVQQRRLGFR